MGALDELQTIVIVMFENRSFDHLLGHLSMPEHGGRSDVEGLVNPKDNPAYVNFHGGEGFSLFPRRDAVFPHDLPHGRASVGAQLAPAPSGRFSMSGFVEAYVQSTGSPLQDSPPMGFLTPADVPTSSFLASEYVVCDHWFAPLPTDTHPNRCVAFSGESLIDDTQVRVIPANPGTLLFDWLDAHQVPWRVYHCGLSFFTLFGRPDLVLGPSFHSFRSLPAHMAAAPAPGDPQVIVIEPEYADSPVHFGRAPNDNHPPLPIGPGENFLREIYTALTANADRWARTLLVVTHDEHGGFFDHVAPPAMETPPPANALFSAPFQTLGPRVPTLVASPWVARGKAVKDRMDHTSILQLLSEKFAGTTAYSPEVERRKRQGVVSLSAVLTAGPGTARTAVPSPPQGTTTQAMLVPPWTPPVTEGQQAFADAGRRLLAHDPVLALQRFPELAHLPPP
jgi:phospholipase C